MEMAFVPGRDPTNPFRPTKAIRVSGALSLAEARQVMHMILPLRSRLIIYAIVFGVFLAVVGAIRPPYPYGLIMLVVLIMSFFFMKSRLGRRASQEGRGFYGVSDLEFDDQGICVATSVAETRLQWQAVSEVLMNDRFIILFTMSRGNYIPIARTWFAKDEEWTRLGDLISRHTQRLNAGGLSQS